MTAPAVREARQADADDIARLCTQLGYPAEAASIPARLRRLAEDGNARVLVAIDDDRVVGVETVHLRFTLNNDAPYAQVTLLVVDESKRGTGAGRALVAAAEGWGHDRGCGRMVVTTALHRAGAHAFYERLGYTHTGRRYGKDFQRRE